MNMAVDPNQAPGLAPAALQLSGITRSFDEGNRELHILNGADLRIEAGEMVALVAPSGTGKSTLLHIAGLLERPDEGEVGRPSVAATGRSWRRQKFRLSFRKILFINRMVFLRRYPHLPIFLTGHCSSHFIFI